jgi:hypothetical protein
MLIGNLPSSDVQPSVERCLISVLFIILLLLIYLLLLTSLGSLLSIEPRQSRIKFTFSGFLGQKNWYLVFLEIIYDLQYNIPMKMANGGL